MKTYPVLLSSTIVLSLFGLFGCGEIVELDEPIGSVQQAWACNYVRGHEDLLRLAIEDAAMLMPHDKPWANAIKSVFPAPEPGFTCSQTSNPLLLGNCATDFPEARMLQFYGVDASEWHSALDLQDLHALRNRKPLGYFGEEPDNPYFSREFFGARETCYGIRARIVTATERGFARWDDGLQDEAYFWWGHATHIIQDAFSPAHAIRQGENLRYMNDICTYEYKVPGVCFHPTVSAGDLIWDAEEASNNPVCKNDLYGLPVYTCIKPEAQAAVRATAGYLRTLAQVLADPSLEIASAMNAYFEDESDSLSGFMQCEQLDDKAVISSGKTDEMAQSESTNQPTETSQGGCSTSTSSSSKGGLSLLMAIALGLSILGYRRSL